MILRWDILICTTVIVGLILYFAISKIILWRETKTTNTTPEPETTPSSDSPVSPTPPVSIRRRIEWEWWNNETWGPIILALVGLLLFWVCLQWYFPETAGLATNKKLWVGIILILVVVWKISPKWLTRTTWTALVILLLLALVSQTGVGENYSSSSPRATTTVVTHTTQIPNSVTVTVKKGEWVEIRVPRSGKDFKTRVTPTTSTVVVRTPDGKTRPDGYGHEKDNWGVTKGGNWEVSSSENETVSYTVSW